MKTGVALKQKLIGDKKDKKLLESFLKYTKPYTNIFYIKYKVFIKYLT